MFHCTMICIPFWSFYIYCGFKFQTEFHKKELCSWLFEVWAYIVEFALNRNSCQFQNTFQGLNVTSSSFVIQKPNRCVLRTNRSDGPIEHPITEETIEKRLYNMSMPLTDTLHIIIVGLISLCHRILWGNGQMLSSTWPLSSFHSRQGDKLWLDESVLHNVQSLWLWENLQTMPFGNVLSLVSYNVYTWFNNFWATL